jgi:hypothetical protein
MTSLLIGLGLLLAVPVSAMGLAALSSRERCVYRLKMPRQQEQAERYLAWRVQEDARLRQARRGGPLMPPSRQSPRRTQTATPSPPTPPTVTLAITTGTPISGGPRHAIRL